MPFGFFTRRRRSEEPPPAAPAPAAPAAAAPAAAAPPRRRWWFSRRERERPAPVRRQRQRGLPLELAAYGDVQSTLFDLAMSAVDDGEREEAPSDGFRRLRDEFLEAIAMAVLDQHEVDTAEAELKRLLHEQEVRDLRSSLSELERIYDDVLRLYSADPSSAVNQASRDKLQQLESRAVIARLLLKASTISQRLLVLRSQQQQRSSEALRLELELTMTLTMISDLRSNQGLMKELLANERRLSEERRAGLTPADSLENEGIPLLKQIACQKFHITCLKARVPGKLKLSLRRDSLLADSRLLLERLPTSQLKKRLCVSFQGEDGRDFGGIAREWFEQLGQDLMALGLQNDYLAMANSRGTQVKLRAAEKPVHDCLAFLRLLGRCIGLALFHNKALNLPMAAPVLQLILRKELHVDLLRRVDEELHRTIRHLLDNPDAEDLDLTFTVDEVDEDGVVRTVELRPYGAATSVTDSNKKAYVDALLRYHFLRDTEVQLSEIRQAVYEVVPEDALKVLTVEELDLLVGGNPILSIQDWRRHTQYDVYEEDSPVVTWFWEVVSEYAPCARAKLLHFVTGASSLPVQGFSGLQGTHSKAPFTLSRNGVPESLPVGHTCTNRLDLPPYPSKEILRQKLDYAIFETQGFGIV